MRKRGIAGGQIITIDFHSAMGHAGKPASAPSLAAVLEQVVFAGYMEGLRQAGWQGDPRPVRLARTAALVIRRLGALGGR